MNVESRHTQSAVLVMVMVLVLCVAAVIIVKKAHAVNRDDPDSVLRIQMLVELYKVEIGIDQKYREQACAQKESSKAKMTFRHLIRAHNDGANGLRRALRATNKVELTEATAQKFLAELPPPVQSCSK